MKIIQLTKGFEAVVDDEDFEVLRHNRWLAQTGPHETIYAARRKNRKYEYMHRVIMGVIDRKVHVDHVNRNGLDNRKENLRLASMSQNLANQRKQTRKTFSIFKGVTATRNRKKWSAHIKVNQKGIYLGAFPSEKIAALAYNFAASHYFGSFARLNEVHV